MENSIEKVKKIMEEAREYFGNMSDNALDQQKSCQKCYNETAHHGDDASIQFFDEKIDSQADKKKIYNRKEIEKEIEILFRPIMEIMKNQSKTKHSVLRKVKKHSK